ncbi:MAG: elongation factor G [Lachnospiraceae bacterium]|nr:elongation factor G [Lachnospiraceae bacterium]
MNVYTSDRIRNVVLLGHGGSGKTTLTEAMAYLAGITNRMGNVTDGNTISDYDKEEIKRKFSIGGSVVPVEWNKVKVNILDTPGYFDFVGEVEQAVSVADAAIILVNGKDGIQVGTEKAWNLCEERNLPRMFFVTGMDNDDVSYRTIVEQLQELYGKKVAPIHMPIRENGKFVGYVSIVKQSGRKFVNKDDKVECPVPDYLEEYLETYHESLMESVAETSEEFMDRYFGGEEFSDKEIAAALATNIRDCSIVPVSMGASINLHGVSNLLDDIVEMFPNPTQRTVNGINQKTNEIFEANYDFQKIKTAYVWKTIADPFIGKYSFIKVNSGVLKADDTLYDVQKESDVRLGKLYVMTGNKSQEVSELFAGDIGALAKLGDVNTGDSLAPKATPIAYPKAILSTPYTAKRYRAVKKGDEDKVASSLSKLGAEDTTFKIVLDAANRQSLIYGIGEQQLEIIKSKLKERYKVDIELMEPKVAFRETIRKKSDVEGKYKKQTGGHGQYGHVKMRFEPSEDQTKAYEFEIEVVGGAVPKNYYPAVEKGLNEAVAKGPLAAYPVVGVKAVLYDGSYHPVDSSEQAFKTATHMAFKDGFLKAGPVLLEPIISLKVKVKDKFTGDVMGDLNKRRGRVLGMNPDHKGNTIIEADVPQKEMDGYGTVLRSMTGGQGEFSYEFARYEQAPADVQEKEIKARADELAEGSDD